MPCTPLLTQVPFWIVISQSVFVDEANKNRPEYGFKVLVTVPMVCLEGPLFCLLKLGSS